MDLLWQTFEDRSHLLKSLVRHQSITHSEGEKTFPYFLRDQYLRLDYFKRNAHQVIFATDWGWSSCSSCILQSTTI